MLKRKALPLFFALSLLVLSSSCSKFRKVQKSGDWKVKYDAAIEYYERGERGDYYKAAVLLEEILPVIRGSKEAEQAQFYYAYAHYYQKQYLLSAHYFKTFAETYSRSDKAEEALFMHAYSLYLTSPVIDLDQTSTYEAIQAMQNFINRYPESEYRKRAAEIIDSLQQKLERKAYDNAKLYYKLGRYQAAIVAFDNFTYNYPGSALIEEIMFLKIETQYNYASQSIRSRQEERFKAVVDFYHEFVDKYPESELIDDAVDYYDKSLVALARLKEDNL